MSCASSYLESSGSSFTIQFKLKQIWKKIRYSNPLLASLVDIENDINNPTSIFKESQLNTENIMKKLGTPITLQLIQMGCKFYIRLFATNANIWAEMRSSKDNKEFNNITIESEEAALLDTSKLNFDDSVTLDQSTFQSINWPSTLYSIVKTALENLSSKPRYSKEVCALHSPLSAIDSTLGISRGDVLCIKIYQKTARVFTTSIYHFGVYIGKMTTKDGRTLPDAVIELGKDHESGNISINAVSLVGTEKGTCFVLENTKSGRPPLLFKVKYKGRTQKEKNETADRTLDIYNNADKYLKKYSLETNNCEHFVNICAFGKPYCEQRAQVVMTTISSAFTTLSRPLRYILVALAELAEDALKSSKILTRALGEGLALAMLVIECVFTIIWDIYLLKQSDRLTFANVLYILKIRLVPMAPEFLVAIGFLLVAVLCAVSGPVGLAIGIPGVIIMLILRFTTRPRIQRWIEEREVARQEDFLQWHPREVARLAMETSEEDDAHEDLVTSFESRKLTGQAITDLINEERNNSSGNHLATALQFLDSTRLDRFKKNLKGILGHFDISELLKSSIELSYGKRSFTIDTYDSPAITASQLLNTARLNWNINFAKGQWQLSTINPEDEKKSVFASYCIDNSIKRTISAIPDSMTKIELSYEEPSTCQLL